MSKLDQVRALFVPGEQVECVENTYKSRAGGGGFTPVTFTVEKVGKGVWFPVEAGFRGTFPTRVSDVVSVSDSEATWKIGRDDHTVTYRKVVS